MDKFWILLEKSTITSGVLVLMLLGVASYCVVAGIPVPGFFTFAVGAVLAWFFTKTKDAEFRQFTNDISQQGKDE